MATHLRTLSGGLPPIPPGLGHGAWCRRARCPRGPDALSTGLPRYALGKKTTEGPVPCQGVMLGRSVHGVLPVGPRPGCEKQHGSKAELSCRLAAVLIDARVSFCTNTRIFLV